MRMHTSNCASSHASHTSERSAVLAVKLPSTFNVLAVELEHRMQQILAHRCSLMHLLHHALLLTALPTVVWHATGIDSNVHALQTVCERYVSICSRRAHIVLQLDRDILIWCTEIQN
jgi:hypothetical protein